MVPHVLMGQKPPHTTAHVPTDGRDQIVILVRSFSMITAITSNNESLARFGVNFVKNTTPKSSLFSYRR